MIKINDYRNFPFIDFGSLSLGDVFEHNKKTFMVIHTNDMSSNAVNLTSGFTHLFKLADQVIKLHNIELIIHNQ